MSNLKDAVEESANYLERVYEYLCKHSISESIVLPTECYNVWKKRAEMHVILKGTLDIFPSRDSALSVVKSLVSPGCEEDEGHNLVKYGNDKIDFNIARHLALTSYQAVTWSIYDRISNVCGRLAGIKSMSDNPSENPKVFETFLGKKDVMGFSVQIHIKEAYSWPINVSYKLRNWLVHEGYSVGSIPMYAGDSIADGFILHDEAVKRIEEVCSKSDDSKSHDPGCVKSTCETWANHDLLEILQHYHAEMDVMFKGLLKWSVSSLISQIASLGERDNVNLADIF